MDFKTVKNKIKSSTFDPIYFFFGDEDYLIDKLIDLIRKKVVDLQTKDFNYDFLYSDDVSGQDIINLTSSLPMMADYRLVIIKSIQKLSTSDKKILEKYIDNPVNSTILVLTANRIDRRKRIYKNLVKKSIWVECKPIYENIAVGWIIKRFKKQGIKISRPAALFMVQLVGVSLRSLDNEIEKIITYTEAKKSIDEKVVSQVVGFYKNYNLWNFTDAVGNKDKDLANKILVSFLEEGVSPPFLLRELTKRVVLLMKIKLMIAKGMNKHLIKKVMGLKNFFLNLYMDQAEKFSQSELRNSLQALQMADLHLKSGFMKPEMVLSLIVYDLTSIGSKKYFINR
ncbi:MAG: DNA polymerase III subunit delta [bacterium]